MRIWAPLAIRAFAILSILLALAGLLLLLQTALLFSARVPKPDDPTYFASAYYVRTAVNLVCLLVLLFATVRLWRLEPTALWICNLLFAFQIVYIVASAVVGLELALLEGERAHQVANSLAATDGIANMGLAPQFLVGYPIIGLVLLNIAYRKLERPTEKRVV